MEVLAGVAAGHDRELRRLELELLDAAGLEQREQRRTACTHDRRLTTCSGSPSARTHPPGDVDLDDVAPVDALLDPVADLADEHRRRVPRGLVVVVRPARDRRAQ